MTTDAPDPARLEPPAGSPTTAVQPVTETLRRGTRLWRAHPAFHHTPAGPIGDVGALFNPTARGNSRFSPLRGPDGAIVPTLYAGATRRAALFETVFRDQMPGSLIDSRQFLTHLLTPLVIDEDIEVVSLHGPGLRSLGLYATDITHTYPSGYPRATRWAAWLHEHTDAAGLAWNSQQDDDERAYVFWEDRLEECAVIRPDTTVHPTPIGFSDGLDWVRSVAAEVRIEVI